MPAYVLVAIESVNMIHARTPPHAPPTVPVAPITTATEHEQVQIQQNASGWISGRNLEAQREYQIVSSLSCDDADITHACAILHPPREEVPGPVHWRPDIILLHRADSTTDLSKGPCRFHCYIVDLACVADEILTVEHEVGINFKAPLSRTCASKFDVNGRPSGRTNPGTEAVTIKGVAVTRSGSVSISKHNRYKRYQRYIQNTLHIRCHIIPLVSGARGFIPSSTVQLTRRIDIRTWASPKNISSSFNSSCASTVTVRGCSDRHRRKTSP
jgi:hypothetical protein